MNCFQKNLWAWFLWLVVFLRHHRVRPTVAMAWAVEGIILWMAIYRHDLYVPEFSEELRSISIGITAYNVLFTLFDWLEYRHSHPRLATFYLAFLVLAVTHLVVATTHHVLSVTLGDVRHMEVLVAVSGLGTVVSSIEVYGADAYFAAQKAYRDTHPQLTRLHATLSL